MPQRIWVPPPASAPVSGSGTPILIGACCASAGAAIAVPASIAPATRPLNLVHIVLSSLNSPARRRQVFAWVLRLKSEIGDPEFLVAGHVLHRPGQGDLPLVEHEARICDAHGGGEVLLRHHDGA